MFIGLQAEGNLPQDQLPSLCQQPRAAVHRKSVPLPPTHAQAILSLRRGDERVGRVADHASDQDRSESVLSRSKAVRSCGVRFSRGLTLLHSAGLTSVVGKND